ncbi:tetratricopeptide repeat protein [Pseudomonas sp. WAC2]|uniref:tetratricopeptide repeat protein n=1 Tax=Pseudomonas sp. WAC2 TaxID=3055057 RepID=UPI0025B079D1|nr:tetratricopeptide repeat protein [Pseudomonas sp. WAC2]MDN3233657.1 tetratricopeptide repeat protein [Pseudomonas sp. WAC2]
MARFPSRLAFALCLLGASYYAQATTVPVEVLSATIKDQKISNASVLVQRNGAQTYTASTDSQGHAILDTTYPDDSDTLLILKKEGYSNLVVKCPCAGMTYAISPVMQNLDGIRVVLTWGANPSDLDSHFSFPGNHVYFDSQQGRDANLDVDDTTSYGPETITLEKKHLGESYVYAVHDFTDRTSPGTSRLGNSQAKVFVYVGSSLVRTYYVPTNKTGNLWTVFRITPEGEFQDINTLQGIMADAENIDNYLKPYQDSSHPVAFIQASEHDSNTSREINRQGEAAYKAGQLDEAIALFQQAIELNPNNGQAYSNLGLTFQKSGRVAEAIWANRKAIALASGNTAHTVRASSYYNIGRIYEAAGQLQDARQQYEWARQQKANPVYDKAIERVSNH